jgi:hypothetical protein
MITTLSVISLDQGKIWSAPANEEVRDAAALQPIEAPVPAHRHVWRWIRALFPIRQKPA